jgi:hypothetical protein
MLAHQATATEPPRQESFRWSRGDIAAALDTFALADDGSQRHTAEQLGIPHATVNYWARHYSPDADDPVDCFFRSAAGEHVLRCILLAALATFHLQGAGGIRLVSLFLQRASLDRFVASSRGALHPLAAAVEADLVAFRDQHQPALVEQMKPKTITLIPDEHFHAGRPCLVGLEPVANFILLECYHDRRDAKTWNEAIAAGTRGMPVEVAQLLSDRAKALICCAEQGLHAAWRPDLFHDQRELLQPLLLPLSRPIQAAQKDLHKAEEHTNKLNMPLGEPYSEDELAALIDCVYHERDIRQRLQQTQSHKEQAVQHVRAISDDYHPFDRLSGKPVTAEEVGARLHRHVDGLAAVVQQADLGEKAEAALNKARTWVGTLMAAVAWFWCVAKRRLEEVDLSEEQEQAVQEKLLAGHYWEMAAGRARSADERKRLKELAERLKQEAWQQGGALAALSAEARTEAEAWAREIAGLFQRSSSSVEGRNGRLSLQHHGHSRVSERRLRALTVMHNYMVKRADGTTAAERFFGQKHQDVFTWLLQRLPDLPRPAAKRPKPPAQALPTGKASA